MQLFIFIFSSKPCSVFLQSHPQDTLCTSFQEKWRIQVFWLKFVQKIDLSLKFQKTNLTIRISILKIWIWNLSNIKKSNIEIRINIFECLYVRVCRFPGKTNTFDVFSPKMDLGLTIQKTIVRIRASILDIPCVPIFSQNEQLWIFRPKFVQKRI